jgi:hypothetical protein
MVAVRQGPYRTTPAVSEDDEVVSEDDEVVSEDDEVVSEDDEIVSVDELVAVGVPEKLSDSAG